MWGNRLGWGISAAISVVMVGLMALLQSSGTTASDMTAKFAADPQNLAPLSLTPAPDTILTSMTDTGDSADLYREAITLYEKSPALYQSVNPRQIDMLEACDKVAEATHLKDMTLFSKDPGKVINFEREKTPIEELRKVGDATATKALMLKAKKDTDGARKYAEAAFALGAKMYKERVVYEELDAGLGIMGAACGVLGGLAQDAGDKERVAQITAFVEARIKFSEPGKSRVYDLHKITKTIDGKISGERAGDVLAVAEKSKERMWRVEACLQLARTHRFVGDEGRAADQRYAQLLLRKIAENDPDPVVKIAAAKARDITDDEYNRQ
jgi:hypothetical protein